ncbi:MAG: hypothetical protein LBS45_10675 [Synergistaceae bacterium]|jgi:hypothetical protein|nr:hypothetical protein [Synergistaceae bacterium]
MSDDLFEGRLADLEARERELEKREKTARTLFPHCGIYERINISAKTLDVIIAVLSLSIVILIIIGALKRP